MGHMSNVIIHGGTFNLAQGDLGGAFNSAQDDVHVNNKDLYLGMTRFQVRSKEYPYR